ncbi:MAG TPA: serpin family protein, partial [Polyangiales bacterium]
MIAPDMTTAISDSDYATFIAHLDQFGLDLGQKMASENQLTTGNLNYSPLSVSYAQAMTYAGARGDTASEMKSVLGDSFADGVFHQ